MNLASGSVTKGGSIPLNLSLTAGSGGSPAALQWTLAYPATDIASFSVAAGSALTSAGKTLTCTSSAGVANCVASGMNATAIGSGVVAVVTATTAAGAPDSSAAIAVTNAVGAYPGATLDTTAATGGTITLLSSAVPVITSSTSASGTVGSAFSYQIAATNSPTSYAATSLPAGLSVNTSTGLISGTPTAAGTSSIALSATNSSGTGNATLTLTVTVGPPVITSSTSASGTVGSAFSYQITATNSPTSYAATSLPAGLSVNTSTGLISGTPTAAGTSSVALSATNGSGAGHATLTLTVTVGPPVITSSTSASGTVGSAFSYQITATNSPTSYAATSLPPGLSVNTATGLVSGTPTAAGTSSVALSATNSSGTGHATLTLTVTVGAPVITSSTSAAGTVGSAFSYQITATNSPTSYAATSLPAGLAVNTSTGLISGTPTAAGTSSVALSATNAAGTGHATLTLTVTAGPPVITSSGAANGIVGSAFSYQIAATNSPTSYAATSLPAGLAVNAATGLISGTPTAAGTSSVALSATNSAGTGHATLTLTVTVGPPVITSSTSAAGTVGSAFSYQITATNSPTSYAATSLPAGLSVNTSTGLISGTPTATGTSSVTLSATNGNGTGQATLTLAIGPLTTAVSFVQVAANAASGTSSSLSASFSANTTAGNLILVGFNFFTTTPSSVTDSQGNTFVEVGSQLTSPGGARSRVYYAQNIKGGADTVTVKLAGKTTSFEVYLTEYKGVNTTGPIDAQAGATGGSGSVSSGSVTTTAAGEMIYAYCVGDSACTVGSGFTPRSTLRSNLIEDKPAASAGSYAATASANAGWTMQLVALKPASSGQQPALSTLLPVTASAASGSAGPAVTGLICTPKIIAAGSHANCELRTSAGPGAALVQLLSSSPQVRMPALITTRASQTSLTFQVSTDPAARGQLATITATSGTAEVRDTIQVQASSAPLLAARRSQTGRAGDLLAFTVTAVDPADLPLILTASRLPAGASFDPASGRFAWTPSAAQAGTHTVAFAATNSASQSSSAEVALTIGDGLPHLSTADRLACSPGARASLSGTGLAGGGATRVRINGQSADVIAASDTLVTFLCPAPDAATPLTATVETESGASNSVPAVIQEAAPAILGLGDSGQGLISFPGATELAMPRNFQFLGHPAQPGDELLIWSTGTAGMVRVEIGNVIADALSADPAPGFPGISTIRVRVPELVEYGDAVPVRLQVTMPDGKQFASNQAAMAVEPVSQ